MTVASLLRPELVAAAAVVVVAAVLVGLRDWRWSVYGLLVYLPFSGIAVLAAYPGREERIAAVLAKDFVFVIPAYLGFLVYFLKRRRRFWFRGAPLVLFALLALLVLVQGFNPELPNRLVGLIGIKIWLFYLPLLCLGYHLVDSRRQLFRVLGLMTAVAVVPAVIGVVEVILYYTGNAQTVYDVYGGAAAAATQNFATFVLPGGCTLRRVPSTFSFFYQYFLFCASMVVISYGWWRGSRAAGKQHWIGGVLFLLLMFAAMLSGVRTALILIPVMVVAMLVLSRNAANRVSWVTVGIGAAVFVIAFGGLGSTTCGVTQHIKDAAVGEFPDVIKGGVTESAQSPWYGLGAGADSQAARYAFPGEKLETRVPYQESWYVKTYLELGIVGLAIVVALLAVVFVRGLAAHRRVRDSRLKVVSAGIVALMGLTLLYNAKAQYFDVDPINVYFWLLTGILMKLPLLGRTDLLPVEREPEREAAPAPSPA